MLRRTEGFLEYGKNGRSPQTPQNLLDRKIFREKGKIRETVMFLEKRLTETIEIINGDFQLGRGHSLMSVTDRFTLKKFYKIF